ncbi:hypothetical protein AB4Z21_16705 [Paenibacillus sp. MCAF20]
MKHSSSYWFSVIVVLIGAACYGILSPIVKLAYDAGFSFEQITVHQIGISVVLLWLLVLLRPKLWRNPFPGGDCRRNGGHFARGRFVRGSGSCTDRYHRSRLRLSLRCYV